MHMGHLGAVSGGIYELCRSVCRHPVLSILDLGARHGEGIGLLGLPLAELQYTAVEPSPRCLPYLISKAKLMSTFHVKVVNGVLGPEAGETVLHILDRDGDQSANLFSNRSGIYGGEELVTVPVIPYDAMDARYNFAKVNIEGAEYSLISDGFFDRFDSFVLEAHNAHVPGMTYVDALAGLRQFDTWTVGDLGYKYCFIVGIRP
jgi:FkbM family methyltransferase